jgi:hypothetical protein
MHTITTQYGRAIQYDLRVRKGSDRIVRKDLKTIDAWLHQEAQMEANYFCDGWMSVFIDGMNPEHLTPAERTILNEYLFGQEELMLHNSAKEEREEI